MGLTKDQPGMCSGCGHEHVRPWGTYCKYVKNAIEKCKELNVSEQDFRLHIDLDAMAAETAQALQDSKANIGIGGAGGGQVQLCDGPAGGPSNCSKTV